MYMLHIKKNRAVFFLLFSPFTFFPFVMHLKLSICGHWLWRMDYKKPMRTGHKQGKMQLTCFSKIGTALEVEQLCLLSCLHLEKQKQVSPITRSRASLRIATAPCLPLGVKDPLKEEEGPLLLAFALGYEAFAFGFCLLLEASVFCFWLFGVGRFWDGKIAEGKRIAE
jgi:hypothetical protein